MKMLEQEGFRYLEIAGRQSFSLVGQEHNHLFFLLEGALSVSCSEFSGRVLSGGEFVLIPLASDTACTVLSDTKAVVFTFGKLSIRDTGHRDGFAILPIREPLERFLTTLLAYMDEGVDMKQLYPIKAAELYILLQAVYTPQEVAALFIENISLI